MLNQQLHSIYENTIAKMNLEPLVDVTDTICVEDMFDETERLAMVETCATLITDFIEQNPLIFAKPEFDDIVRNNVISLLMDTIAPTLYNANGDFSVIAEEEIRLIYQMASYIVFTSIAPRRSYKKTFIRKIAQNHDVIRQKLQDIRERPQSEQCTPQWYIDRWNRLSGSNAWKAFSTQSQINSLIVEKCKPIDTNKYRNVNTESSLHHGKRFEQVSVQYYEYVYGAKVAEFGCVPHSEHAFLGASPDGIVVNEDCPRFGRMLEIKNVTTRKINGIPKEDYWIQMQIQMEVCNLNECDFLETEINTYPSVDEFKQDGTFQKSADGKYKGVIAYYTVDGQPFYEYAPFQCTEEEFDKWEEEICEKHANHTWITNIYYRIDTISCVLVLRNKMWMKSAIGVLRDLWGQILHDREHGYEHRLPKSRTSATANASASGANINININTKQPTNKPNCVFNIVKLQEQINNEGQTQQTAPRPSVPEQTRPQTSTDEIKNDIIVSNIPKKRKTRDNSEPLLYVDI